jgi:hypothetical protein
LKCQENVINTKDMEKNKWVHPGIKYDNEMNAYGKKYYGFNEEKPQKNKTKLNADTTTKELSEQQRLDASLVSKNEAMNLILYGRNDNVIIDENTSRLDVIFEIMLQKIKPDVRESFEKILWQRVMNLANYR